MCSNVCGCQPLQGCASVAELCCFFCSCVAVQGGSAGCCAPTVGVPLFQEVQPCRVVLIVLFGVLAATQPSFVSAAATWQRDIVYGSNHTMMLKHMHMLGVLACACHFSAAFQPQSS